MKKLWFYLVLVFSFCAIFSATASTIEQARCEPYLGNKDNYLFNLGLVAGNSDNPNDKNSEELFPDKNIEKSHHLIQYFYLTKYHKHKKILLECVYNDGDSTVKIIPNEAKVCIREYAMIDQKESASAVVDFYCK